MNKPPACSLAVATLGMMLVMVCNHCPAANITWAAPQKITGDSDVSLNGVLVRALNATLFPPLAAGLANVPYYIVRLEKKST